MNFKRLTLEIPGLARASTGYCEGATLEIWPLLAYLVNPRVAVRCPLATAHKNPPSCVDWEMVPNYTPGIFSGLLAICTPGVFSVLLAISTAILLYRRL